MSERYLWDRSGKPDVEIQRLEALLKPLAHHAKTPDFAVLEAAPAPRRYTLPVRWEWLAGAAATLVVVIGVSIWWSDRAPGAAWRIATLEGQPRIAAKPLQGSGRLAVGEWLETGPGGRARADIGSIGHLEIHPETRLRLVKSGARKQRLALARGTIAAVILAPPGQFEVETPSATAVDLGCAYTLSVDSTGVAIVRVTSGWVGFDSEGAESFIPSGAVCETRPDVGPGVPSFLDAEPGLAAGLQIYTYGAKATRDVALDAALDYARPKDAFSLWHLLQRTQGPRRARVYDRLAALSPPPAGVTRKGVLRGNRRMLDRWWDTFGLGDAKTWRRWKGSWPG